MIVIPPPNPAPLIVATTLAQNARYDDKPITKADFLGWCVFMLLFLFWSVGLVALMDKDRWRLVVAYIAAPFIIGIVWALFFWH